MKKLLLTITILALIVCFGSVIYAAEGEGDGILTTENLTTTEAVVGSDTAANSDITTTGTPDTGFTPLPDESLPAEGDTNTETPGEGETSLDDLSAIIEELKTMIKTEEPSNVAEWLIYKLCGDWAPIVYLVLTGSLAIFLIVLEWKKKLPEGKALREGLTKFAKDMTDEDDGFTTKMKKAVAELSENMGAEVTKLETSVAEALASVQAVIEKVAELQKKQDTAEKDRKVLETVLTNETEMLNTIIQASTLAQWKKDEIGLLHKENLISIKKMTEDTDTTEGGEGV